jgi:hypothetical protein
MIRHNETIYEEVNVHIIGGTVQRVPLPKNILDLAIEQPVSDFPEENLTFPAEDKIPPTIKFAETL